MGGVITGLCGGVYTTNDVQTPLTYYAFVSVSFWGGSLVWRRQEDWIIGFFGDEYECVSVTNSQEGDHQKLAICLLFLLLIATS